MTGREGGNWICDCKLKSRTQEHQGSASTSKTDERIEFSQSGRLASERCSRVDSKFDQKPGSGVPEAKTRKIISHSETKVAPEDITLEWSKAQDPAQGPLDKWILGVHSQILSWFHRNPRIHRLLRVPEPFSLCWRVLCICIVFWEESHWVDKGPITRERFLKWV